jgi:hypothetical protein
MDGHTELSITLWLTISYPDFPMATQISKKRKFVADGVFRAELNEFFTRELAEEQYSGCDVRVTHARTEVDRVAIYAFHFPDTFFVADYHSRHQDPGSPRREGSPYSGTHSPGSKTLQIPRKLAGTLC